MENRKINITENIFSYSKFVCDMEVYYSHLECWEHLEILNAIALNEWEMSGRPVEWVDWSLKYRNDAEKLIQIFLSEIS
ncbi:hypothetical protein ACWIUH_12310 [Ursidibacter arcticus]